MKKISVIIDSFSGRSKKEVEAFGLEFIPQTTIIDGIQYSDGVDIELKNDFQKISDSKNIKSSMPAIGLVIEKYEKLSSSSKVVAFLPMNKSISGTYSTAVAAASDFENVHVVENNFVASASIEAARYLKELVEDDTDIKVAIKLIKDISARCYTSVIPRNVASLIKSGRLTGIKKIILEKAKLLPVVLLAPEGFVVKAVKRDFEKAIVSSLQDGLTLIGGIEKQDEYNFEIIHCGSADSLTIAENAFKSVGVKTFGKVWANTPIAGHSGIGAIGVNIWPKMIKEK